ncbi:MAG: ACT domain-containing protein [archaeon]
MSLDEFTDSIKYDNMESRKINRSTNEISPNTKFIEKRKANIEGVKILKESELEFKNKIAIVVLDKSVYTENFIEMQKKSRRYADIYYTLEGVNAISLIMSKKILDSLENLSEKNIIKVLSEDLALVTIRFPESANMTPGVLSYIYAVLSENNINIYAAMTSWTDALFVISEDNLTKVMTILKG